MRHLCVGGITVLLMIFGPQAFARPLEASGTIQEAMRNSSGEGSVQTKAGAKNQASESTTEKVEKAWVDLKAKAKTLWGSYFGDSPQSVTGNSGGGSPQAVAAKPMVVQPDNSVAELKKELPDYKTADKGFSRSEVEQAKQSIRNEQGIVTLSPGRKGTTDLPLSQAGVPKYSFYETKSEKQKSGKIKSVKIKKKRVPLLDIGEEETISAQQLADLTFEVKRPVYSEAKALKEPKHYSQSEVKTWLTKKIADLRAFDEKEMRKGLVDGYPVTREAVDKIVLNEKEIAEFAELPVKHLSQEEQDMLTALIVNRSGKNCHLVIGLLDNLSRQKEFIEEASFHLGVCAQKLQLYSQAVDRLTKVIRAEEPTMASEAIAVLVMDLPREYEVRVTRVLEGLKNKSLIPETSWDDVNYVMAKGYYDQKKYQKAEEHAQAVSSKSKRYVNARYLLGISQYAGNKMKKSIATLLELRQWMEIKSKGDKNVASLMAINIARIYFNIGDFKMSLAEYKKIGKDHPVWVQGLIEQGWAQVLLDDNSGAIGNMHSLHSPYFKAVYKPESYVVRSIGYLNICQYADAYKSLARMEQEYIPWLQRVDGYVKTHSSPADYYNTVKNYLRSPSGENVDNLPYQVIREMGRSRDFLNFQTSINDKVDEGERYPEIPGRIQREINNVKVKMNRSKNRLAQADANLNKAKSDSSLIKHVNEWKAQKRNERDIIVGYQFLLKMLGKSKSRFVQFSAASNKRLGDEKYALRQGGAKALQARLKEMRKEMSQYIANNELLRYEVFSGAGENIRYQVAGGATATPNRIPASVKPQKILNWEFDGEYWEDEIGNYRSRAKDNCPQKGKVSSMVKKGAQVLNEK